MGNGWQTETATRLSAALGSRLVSATTGEVGPSDNRSKDMSASMPFFLFYSNIINK